MIKVNKQLIAIVIIFVALMAYFKIDSVYQAQQKSYTTYYIHNELKNNSDFELGNVLQVNIKPDDIILTYNQESDRFVGFYLDDDYSLKIDDKISKYSDYRGNKAKYIEESLNFENILEISLTENGLAGEATIIEDLRSNLKETALIEDEVQKNLSDPEADYHDVENKYWIQLSIALGLTTKSDPISDELYNNIENKYQTDMKFTEEKLKSLFINVGDIPLSCNEQEYCYYNQAILEEMIHLTQNNSDSYPTEEEIQAFPYVQNNISIYEKYGNDVRAESDNLGIVGEYYYEIKEGEKFPIDPTSLELEAYDSVDGEVTNNIELIENGSFIGDGTDSTGYYYIKYTVYNSQNEENDFVVTIKVK